VDLKKKAVGGILSVTLVSARNLLREGSELGRDSNGSSLDRKSLGNFVEIACEDLMRKTQIQGGDSSPVWDETIDMVLHDNTGTVHFNIYEQAPDNVKYDFIGNCEVKVMVSSAKSFCSEKQIASHSLPFNKVAQKLILQV
jgi:hypothetical protein